MCVLTEHHLVLLDGLCHRICVAIRSFPIINEITLICSSIALESCLETFVPLLGWLDTTLAPMAKCAVPVLLTGQYVRIPSLQSFRALVVSPGREILGFQIKPLI